MTAPTLFDTEAPAATTAAGPRPLTIALDVAIGTTGVAGDGWTDHVRAKAKTLHGRFAEQQDGCASFYRHADFAVIEGAAFSKARFAGMDQLSAMRWMIRHDLWKRDIPYAVVPPDQRIKYVTGTTQPKDPATGKRASGDVLKGIVRDAAAELFGVRTEGRARYDEADALVLYAMARDWLGDPLATVPALNRQALAACTWPEREAVTVG
ncbi:hypothetical protein OG746_26910 [Streptomyces sp. NBC_01016]|uniref:hypothetical protein n=1 Tax=Streptomyces sp. NBC_01016 TaxID=2903720 RepID=UPI002256271F|nr:hypothetical protein [Streptomyces sp. NBC_01016]MCX4827138.1 hypothetical protein [Streptomyces sp. NBC_01016]MCX4832373.1 hypothetical protein [Streptomyces sp. NBC_01016]